MRLPCNCTRLTLSGTTCYCANSLSIAPCNSPGWPSYCGGQLAYPMECTSPCSGDSSYQCGNALVLNLYAFTGSPIPLVGRAELPSSSSANSVALTSNSGSATPTSSTGTPMVTTSTSYPGTTSASTSSNDHSTSTIYETQFLTITSCAPTITHCPARNTSMSMVSRPVAIVIYSTEWITISSCAPVVTNCPYSVSTRMVPVTTITLHGNPPSPTPKGSTMMPTAIPTPGNGGVVPSNGTAPGNIPIIIVSGATGNGLIWSSFVAVGFVFVGMFWA
jgi:hypothetical protein